MSSRRLWKLSVAVLAAAFLVSACGGAAESPAASAEGSASPEASTEGSASPEAGKPYNIWYVNPLSTYQLWGLSNDIFAEAAATVGYEPTIVGPTTIDITAMVQQMEAAIADGADGIITCVLDPPAFADVIAKAQAAGIVVISIGCVDDTTDFTVGTSNEDYGRLSADLIAEAQDGTANVAVMVTARETPNQVAQVEGFNAQVAEKYPGIKLLAIQPDNSDPVEAAEKMGALLDAYPELDTLWMVEGASPGVVPTVFQERDIAPGEIFVMAIDTLDATVEAIESGYITTTLRQCYFEASPFAAELIIAKLEGRAPSDQFYAAPIDPVTKAQLPYDRCPPELVLTLDSLGQ